MAAAFGRGAWARGPWAGPLPAAGGATNITGTATLAFSAAAYPTLKTTGAATLAFGATAALKALTTGAAQIVFSASATPKLKTTGAATLAFSASATPKLKTTGTATLALGATGTLNDAANGTQQITGTATLAFSAANAAIKAKTTGTAGMAFAASGALVGYTLTTVRPDADTTDGAWLPSVPGDDLFDMIDESAVDDADYIYTESASTCRMSLGAMTDPAVNYGHSFTYRIKGDGATTIEVRLGGGSTTVATYTHAPAPSSLTTYTQTLSSAEVAGFRAAGGYTDGWIEFEAT